MNIFIKILILALVSTPVLTYAGSKSDSSGIMPGQTCNDCCANIQTPVGVMTDHIHAKGTWGISYTYMDMMMSGNRMGTNKVSDDQVYHDYMMGGSTMSMQMHMFMVMYGITDKLTVMGMTGYVVNNMNMNMDQEGVMTMMNMPGMNMGTDYGSNMTSSSSGIADTKIYGLYNLFNNCGNRLIGSMGINIPTGSVTATGMTLISINDRLPYAMQIGTGSFALMPAITYTKQCGFLMYGAEAGANINLGANTQGYKWGNTYNATAWLGYRFISAMSASLRVEGTSLDKMTGYDNKIALSMNNDPTANTANYGGQTITTYIGLNYSIKKLNGLRIMAEYGIPVYQNLNGVQMSQHGNLLAGVKKMF